MPIIFFAAILVLYAPHKVTSVLVLLFGIFRGLFISLLLYR